MMALPTSYTLTAIGCYNDDASDIELRAPDEKITIASEVDDRFTPLFLAAPDLLAVCERIAKPRDCGCRPCRGQCISQEALLIEAQEMREIARAAIAKARSL